jgi:hypothetical protein
LLELKGRRAFMRIPLAKGEMFAQPLGGVREFRWGRDLGCYLTKFAPYNALKLIARKSRPHRVGSEHSILWVGSIVMHCTGWGHSMLKEPKCKSHHAPLHQASYPESLVGNPQLRTSTIAQSPLQIRHSWREIMLFLAPNIFCRGSNIASKRCW